MEQKNTSLLQSALVNGLILALGVIIYSVLIYIMDLTTSQIAGYISYLVIAGLLVFGIKSYRDNVLGGTISYGRSLGFGMLMLLFGGILYAVYTYIMFKFIDPGLMDKTMAVAEEKMLERGLSDEQIEMALEMSRKWTSPGMTAIGAFIGTVVWGFILSLIVSIFMKKEAAPAE
ncbi:MAG: DUF4199 domain-containing protein [Bacteroidales bacterium]